MHHRNRSFGSFLAVMTLTVGLSAGAMTPLAAQQATVAATTQTPPALRGPRVAAPFQRFEPRLAPANAFVSSRQGPVVISTLSLVLIIILVVLLV